MSFVDRNGCRHWNLPRLAAIPPSLLMVKPFLREEFAGEVCLAEFSLDGPATHAGEFGEFTHRQGILGHHLAAPCVIAGHRDSVGSMSGEIYPLFYIGGDGDELVR